MVVYISVKSVVIFSLLFFTASIWLWCLIFFINLASGLSILLIFLKNQLLNLLIFRRVFLVYISFSSALILATCCLLLGFEFFDLAPLALNFDDRVSILDLSLLLVWTFIAIYFPVATDSNVSQRFWYVVSVLVGFEEHFYFCLHFIAYPVNIQEPVVQFSWSCAVLS